MKVVQSKKGILVSQLKQVHDLLKETGMVGCRLANKPMDNNYKQSITKESLLIDKRRYQHIGGKLIFFLLHEARHQFLVNVASKFINPTEKHMERVYRILRYVKMNPSIGLFFTRSQNRDIQTYSKANWVGAVISKDLPQVIVLMHGETQLHGVRSNLLLLGLVQGQNSKQWLM